MVLLFIYFHAADLKEHPSGYIMWCVGVIIFLIMWAWCNMLVMINSPLGVILLANTIMDFLCFSKVYYCITKEQFEWRNSTVSDKINDLFDWIWPFSR